MMETLKKRSDFLRVARGRRAHRGSMVVQAAPTPQNINDSSEADSGADIRMGFTATKKIGNAVIRNRAKRRLREAAKRVLPLQGRPGHDYVLIARASAVSCPFDAMLDDLRSALVKLHAEGPRRRGHEGTTRSAGNLKTP